MKFCKIIFSVFFFLLIFSCKKDSPLLAPKTLQVSWVKTLGGNGMDSPNAIIELTNGNIAILGSTNSMDGDISDKILAVTDLWLTVMDIDGNVLWSKTYGGSGEDYGTNLIETSDGGFALVGYVMSSDGDSSNNEGFHDNWIIKLDANGNILWEKSYGFSGHDHAYDVIQTDDEGFIITGFLDVTASGGKGNQYPTSFVRHGIGEFWTHKLDANGQLEWRRYLGGSSNDRSFSIAQANNNNYLIAGFSESNDFDISNSNGSYDFWVVSLDENVDVVWEKSFGGTGIDQGRSIIKTLDQNFLFAGNSFSTDGDISNPLGGSDFWLVKLNENGQMLWEKSYGGSGFESAEKIKKASTGYWVVGNSKSHDGDLTLNKGENDIWVIQIDENGDLIYEKSFGGSGLDFGYDVLETTNNVVYIIGKTESSDGDIIENKGGTDALIIKLDYQ